MKKNEHIFKSILMGLIILGMALFAYFVVTSVQAEGEAVESLVTGRLLLPAGVEIPEGMEVGLFYPDFEAPPEPYPIPFPTEEAPRVLMGADQPVENIIEMGGMPDESYVYEPPITTVSVDPTTGEFSFPSIYSGLFVLNLLPPAGSNLMTDGTIFVEAYQSTVDLGDIEVIEAQVTGNLVNPEGDSVLEGYVTLIDESALFYKTARSVNGRYFMSGIPEGEYVLRAYPSTYEYEVYPSDPVFITIEDESALLNQPLEFSGPALYGTVYTPDGRPYPDSEIYVYSVDDGPYEWAYAYADYQGEWRVGNLRDGSYKLQVNNYQDFDNPEYLPPEPIDIVIPAEGLPLDLNYSLWPVGLKVLEGQLVDKQGNPALNGVIYATNNEKGLHRNTPTDDEGRFSLDLVGGTWRVEAYHSSYDEIEWINLGPAIEIEFADDQSEEVEVISFEVTRYDAYITGELVSTDPDVPLPYYYVSLYSTELGYDIGQYFEPGEPFLLRAPEGSYELSVYIDNYEFAPIESRSVELTSGQTVNLGIINAVAPSSKIKGQILTSFGSPAPGVDVFAYNTTLNDYDRSATTDADGNYEIRVHSGLHSVYPSTNYTNFHFSGESQNVQVAEGETVEGVDFVVQEKNSKLIGTLHDGEGNRLFEIEGWVSVSGVENNFYSSTYISNGEFEIDTVGGDYSIYLEVYSIGYLFPLQSNITIDDGATVNVEIQAVAPDAKIVGNLVDFRTGEPILGVPGWIYGYSYELIGVAESEISAADGSFELDVPSGIWNLDWYPSLPPHSEFSPIYSSVSPITVTQGSTATAQLPLIRSDAKISGDIIDSNENGIPYSYVIFTGQGDLDGYQVGFEADFEGRYSGKLPYGSYLVRSYQYDYDFEELPPDPVLLTLEEGEAKTNFVIQYEAPDTPLTVSMFAPGLTEGGNVWVDLNSQGGGFRNVTRFIFSDGNNGVGTFTEHLNDGVWHIHASLYLDSGQWFASGSIIVDGPTEVELELSADTSQSPKILIEIQPGQGHTLSYEDGAIVDIPASALPAEHEVSTISLESGNYLPLNGETIPLDSSYQLLGWDSVITPVSGFSFAEPISITLPYDPAVEDFMSSDDFGVMFIPYFDQGHIGTSEMIEEFTVDEANKTVSFTIDEFGVVGIVAPAESMPANPTFSDIFSNQIILPFVPR